MPFIKEFLWVGKDPDNADNTPQWHVLLAATSVDGFGKVALSEKMLNVTQAIDQGYTLDVISESINADTLTALEEAQVENAALKAEIEALKLQLAAAPVEAHIDE